MATPSNREHLMTSKNLLLMSLVAVALNAGCVASDSPIVILNAAVLPTGVGADCATLTPTSFATRGSLDLSAGVGYFASFFNESNLQPVSTVVGADTIADTTNHRTRRWVDPLSAGVE